MLETTRGFATTRRSTPFGGSCCGGFRALQISKFSWGAEYGGPTRLTGGGTFSRTCFAFKGDGGGPIFSPSNTAAERGRWATCGPETAQIDGRYARWSAPFSNLSPRGYYLRGQGGG